MSAWRSRITRKFRREILGIANFVGEVWPGGHRGNGGHGRELVALGSIFFRFDLGAAYLKKHPIRSAIEYSATRFARPQFFARYLNKSGDPVSIKAKIRSAAADVVFFRRAFGFLVKD
jgi:hypothetical protein